VIPGVLSVGNVVFDVNEPPKRVITMARHFKVIGVEHDGDQVRYKLRNRYKTKLTDWRVKP